MIHTSKSSTLDVLRDWYTVDIHVAQEVSMKSHDA